MSLPEVYFDGEKVVFEGAALTGFEELLRLLHAAAEGAGRIVAGVVVDGVAIEDVNGSAPLESIGRIDVRTISIREALRRLCGECAVRLRTTADDLARLDVEVLRAPWTTLRSRCIAWAESLGSLVQEASVVANHAESQPWHDAFAATGAAVVATLEAWVEAVGAGDAARVCVSGERSLLPALRRFESVLGEVEAALE